MKLIKIFFNAVFFMVTFSLKSAEHEPLVLSLSGSTGDVIIPMDSAERISEALITIDQAIYKSDDFIEAALRKNRDSVSLTDVEQSAIQKYLHDKLMAAKKCNICSIVGIATSCALVVCLPVILSGVCLTDRAQPGGYLDTDVARLCGMSTGAVAQSVAILLGGTLGGALYALKQHKNVPLLKRAMNIFGRN